MAARAFAEPMDSRCLATSCSGFILSVADDIGANKEIIAEAMKSRQGVKRFLCARGWWLLTLILPETKQRDITHDASLFSF